MAPKKKQDARFYQVGDLVAVKIKGHPFWPAEIEQVTMQNNRPRYVVRYFGTGQTSNLASMEMKLFEQMTEAELSKKNVLEAVAQCRERLNQKNGVCKASDNTSKNIHKNDNASSNSADLIDDGENNLVIEVETAEKDINVRPIKRLKVNKSGETSVHLREDSRATITPRSNRSRPIRHKCKDNSSSETELKQNDNQSLDTISRDAKKSTAQSSDESNLKIFRKRTVTKKGLPISSETITQLETNNTKPSVSDQEIYETASESSPNNDLSENDNGDIDDLKKTLEEKLLTDQAKSNHSLSKSSIDHNSRLASQSLDSDENVMQNQTIEKLKKKIAIKMQEKEALKIIRLQRKAYERASKKFPTVYKKLDQVLSISEKALASKVNTKVVIIKLGDVHRNIESTLLKCIDKLTTDYGKRQADCLGFQRKLINIIQNLKRVRENQRTSNPEVAKVAKKVLKVYKTKAIREFVNNSLIAENLNEVMNDRKENDAIKME